MKYEAIEKYSSMFEVRKMCQVLGLKSQNYYRWKKQRVRNESKRRKELEDIQRIERVFLESDRIYGYRKIQKQLEKDGYKISEYRIRRIMRENGFYPETQRKYKPIHNGKVDGMYSENIVNQNFRTKIRKEVV